jgi:hypothetical protein
MKRNHFKLVLSMVFLLFLITPGAASGMSAPVSSDSSLPAASEVAPVDTSFSPHPSSLDPDFGVLYVVSTEAVYVQRDEEENFNSGAQRSYLLVHPWREFEGETEALIRFYPIELPGGAEITGVRVRLHQISGYVDGAIDMYALQAGFDEDTVTWSTKPPRGAFQGTTELEAGSGPRYLDISTSLVESWIESPSTNHGIVLVYSGLSQYGQAFSSDETSSPPTLIISYEGKPVPPPPPPPEDTEPCEISYTVTPPSPTAGQEVTITATATDNEAMDYIELSSVGEVLAFARTETGETTLTVSATLVAQLPALQFSIRADDFGPAPPVRDDVLIPTGTGTIPEVTIETDWEIEEVIPERYRLIKEDGQTVTITVTATDPDGIDSLTIYVPGGPYGFAYEGETSVSETITWVNDDPSFTSFGCDASVIDREGNYGRAEGDEHFHINQPQDIEFMWYAAPGFHNPSWPDLPWNRMRQAFGDGECYTWEKVGWVSAYAWAWYKAAFEDIAKDGECFGMSTTAIEIYHYRIWAHQLEYPLQAFELSYPNSYTKQWVESRQGGQLGEEVVKETIDQYVEWWAEVGRHLRKLGWIEEDLENDDPGVICICEGGSGHAIVPWMVRYMADGTMRVYVYDCNYASDVNPDGIHNPNADINNFAYYPYMEFDADGWSYGMAGGGVWNDDLYYYSYRNACGDMDQLVSPALGEDAPKLTDHDLPSLLDCLVAVFSGDADVYVEDEEGNITGIYKGEIRKEIPGAVIIPMMGGSFTDHEMYALPIDEKLTIHAVGKGEGEYYLGLMGGHSLYALEEKSLSPGVEDRVIIEPFVGAVGHRLRMQPGKADDDFILRLAFMFEGRVKALDRDYIDREYIFEHFSALDESDFSVYVEEGGESAVVESYGDDIEFDVTMRSTESADYVDPEQELPYIPSSSEEDVSVERGRGVTATPDDWATTEERGEMHTLKKTVKEEGVGFPVVPVVIGLVAIAAIVAVLVKKGVVGKTKKG